MKLDQTELISYLGAVVETTKKLKLLVESRNKTKKFKAIKSMLVLLEARVSSSLAYCKAGGYSEFPLTMQQQLYTPILEYLAGEIST